MAKKMILIVLAMMLIFASVGCSMVTVNEERDGQRVVATVNGVDITKAEVASQLTLYLSYMGLEPGSDTYEQYYDSMVEDYLEATIIMELCRQKCEEFGIEPITAEQQAEIEADLQSTKDFAESLADTNILEEDYDTTAQYEAAKEAYIQRYLDEAGYSNGSQRETLERGIITDNLIAYLVRDYDPSETEIKAFYDRELADQKTVIDSQLSSFTNFETDSVPLYTPEGINYIKYVYVALDDEAIAKIDEAESDEEDAVREEELKAIKATADEALEAAKEDFMAAVEKYNPEGDSMMTETAKEEGLRIYEGSTFEAPLAEAANELKNAGDISGLIETDSGYYILQLVSKVTPGEAKFEDVKDELKELMIEQEKDSVFTVSTGEWLEEATIKYYKDRL